MALSSTPQCPRDAGCSDTNLSSFTLGVVPCYVGIASDSLSCVAAVVMVGMYVAWKDIRKKGAQSIVTFIAIADFFTAAAYLAGSVNILRHYNVTAPARCEFYETFCEVESYVVTIATMSSYFWTLILALHFYLTVARNSSKSAARFMPLYHVIAWGLPIVVALPLLCTQKLPYAPFVGGIWCYLDVLKDTGPFSGYQSTFLAVLPRIPEVVFFIAMVVFYLATRWSIHKQARGIERSTDQVETLERVERILTLIPLLFVLLRVWCTVQYFNHHSLAALAIKHNGCIPRGLKDGYIALGILQAIGAGGQGWANAVLYIFLSPTIRHRLIVAPLKKLLSFHKSTESLPLESARSSTYVSPPASLSNLSTSTESVKNLF